MTKRVLIGRLESTKEYKAENTEDNDTKQYTKVENLKISVRDLNEDDIKERNLPKNLVVLFNNYPP